MMKRLLFFALLCSLFFSCNKHSADPSSQNPTQDPSIYVAGAFYANAGTQQGNYSPGYWKNGTWMPLTDSSVTGFVYAMDVSGADVACGGVLSHVGYNLAVCWRNGIIDTLSNTGIVYGIQLANGDIYATGYTYTEGEPATRACYWKNGQQFLLSQDHTESFGESVCIAGNDMYVAGSEGDFSGVQYGRCWKNGNMLFEGPENSGITDIAIIGADIYQAGAIYNSGSNAFVSGYWKNGQWTPLSDPAQNCLPGKMIISGTDVYITGQSGTEMGYWKNGQWNHLENAKEVKSIAGYDNDIYVCGAIGDQAGYWKNGSWTGLGPGRAFDIVIQ